jgi:hypothetical protein
VEDSCEHDNEPSGSIKHRETLKWLHNWWLLKKGSAPWSYRPVQYLSANKSTVHFKGHLVFKMCNPQKPTSGGFAYSCTCIPQMVMFVASSIIIGLPAKLF